VLALEAGESDALGANRKSTVVLREDSLLVATPVRTRTILTTIPRADIRGIEESEANLVEVVFDDYDRAIRRAVRLDLRRHRDRHGIVEQLRASLEP
jgi:hypothetical protein